MNNALRRASIVALSELGRSDDYRDRADAGRGLAGFAELDESVGILLDLMLDAGDTFVTLVTVESVLRRKDRIGLAIVASALAVADADHAEWIYTAIVNVFGVFSSDRDEAMQICEGLTRDSDENVSLGARGLIGLLADIDPVLRPA
ncbi:hypothetical protein [Kitasatospora sp. MMS16-BH015]|uniref:hypothetical protein n=1 Tax=Kitasatospora sp. MMS16-BH015 TaxID=2018025 RepID=UPI0020C53003|nr:hypothetical protein [Kitasatospora sp. MMS16-BH015]